MPEVHLWQPAITCDYLLVTIDKKPRKSDWRKYSTKRVERERPVYYDVIKSNKMGKIK